MASTYSPSLRLELMGTGDQSGTWGDTTNTNLGTLLEQAITGFLSVAEGDTTLTLTSLDGAADQARNMIIDLTGAMTAGRNVIVPTAEKLYLFKNSTTGGYATTIKTAAGTGVAIAAGTSQWVYCDGTNVVQGLSGTLATQTAAAVAITGGTITGLTSLTLASGTASPATNDAAALGTGALGWSDLFLASGGVINIANGNWVATHTSGILTVGTGDLRVTSAGTNAASVVTVGGTQTLTAKTLTSPAINTPTITAASYAAGTTSAAPIKLTSGTNLTTAEAGAFEYDGKAIYATAAASSRQVVPATQIVVAASAVALSNSSTSAQNIFAAGNDVLTVQGDTTYAFEALIFETTGTTSHTVSFGLGGTATFTSIMYQSEGTGFSAAGVNITTTTKKIVITASATSIIGAATTDVAAFFRTTGTMRINAGGTIIPQITHSAGPTGTCQIEPNSYFRCWPVGSGAVEAVGNWA